MKQITSNQQPATRNLIVCSPQLGLLPNSILGGEVFDRETLLGLARRGVRVEVILPKNKAHDQNIKNWHITYLPIKHFPAIFGNLIFIPYLFLTYKKNRFQLIRLHSPRYLGIAALIFRFFNVKVKIVATYHQFSESKFWPFSKIINSLWDHIICDSQNVKNKLIKSYNLKPSKITVVHNGVPTYLKPAPKDKTLIKKLKLEGKIVLLFMGLFIVRKNPLFLLDVLSNLKKIGPDPVLLFWGDGPLKGKILAKAHKLNLADQIRIINPVYGLAKNKIHNLADVFVHPAVDEGFALAPLEAMACAKPVLMTNDFSAKEVVEDNINGFLCHSNDTNHWSGQLIKLIQSPRLRQKMGRASLDKVKKEFQWEHAIKRHIEVLRNLTSK